MLRQLPNTITALRILLVLPLGWAIVARRGEWALGVALVAGISDALDGFLARRCGWMTRLGAFLDPAADKAMLTVAFVTLAWTGRLPWWLAALVIARDLVIVTGALAYRLRHGTLEIAPTRLSKANTALQIAYVLVVLVEWNAATTWPIGPLAWLVAVLTVASGVDYVVRYARKPSTQELS